MKFPFPFIWILFILYSGVLVSKNMPYTQYKHPYHSLSGKKGVIVSQNNISSNIGLSILEQGGNAIDAAVAIGFSLAATLPRAGNIGGGGFMMIYSKKQETVFSLDFRSQSPASANSSWFQTNGIDDPQKRRFGYKAIAVPGTVAGLIEAHNKFGNLPLKKLIKPTIKLCKKGFIQSTDRFYAIQSSHQLKEDLASQKTFLDPIVKIGTKAYCPKLAKTLARISQKGTDGFYKGKTAKLIVEAMKQNNGGITLSDLANYKPNFMKPIKTQFKNHSIYAQAPPSGGGIAVLKTLNIMENFNLDELQANSVEYLHLLSESLKYGHLDRSQFIGDPNFYKVPIQQFLDKAIAKELASRISNLASSPQSKNPYEIYSKESEDTTHFSVIDKHGNAVSTTYTLGYSFGSGVTIPQTGILMNNQMNNFAHQYGINQEISRQTSPANKLLGNKRPMSTMTPVFVFDENNHLKLITGSPGGSKIPDAITQVILNILVFDMDLGLATMTPRIFQDWPNTPLQYELTLNPEVLKGLKRKKHVLKLSPAIGSTQSILIKDEQVYGFADLRRPNASVAIQRD